MLSLDPDITWCLESRGFSQNCDISRHFIGARSYTPGKPQDYEVNIPVPRCFNPELDLGVSNTRGVKIGIKNMHTYDC